MKQHTTIIITIFLELIIFFIFLYWYYEEDQFTYLLKCLINSSLNKSGLPTSRNIMNKITQLINKLPKLYYTLIDFGSGGGDFINNMHNIKSIKNTIGIELDINQANNTKKQFSEISSVTILNMDMVDYKFKSVPTILYMYEPLWCLKKEDALPIYHNVMNNISLMTDPCYIIYVSAIYPILDSEFFKLYPFKIIYHSYVQRLIGFNLNHVYVLKHK